MEHEGIDVTAPDRLTALSNVAALEILVTRSILRLFPGNLAGPLRVWREDRTGIEKKMPADAGGCAQSCGQRRFWKGDVL
jgi:hypothetical protein